VKSHPLEIKEAARYRWMSRRESSKSIATNLEISYKTLRNWIRLWKEELERAPRR
jgi:DNA-binding CsgD family transcriptional regulator